MNWINECQRLARGLQFLALSIGLWLPGCSQDATTIRTMSMSRPGVVVSGPGPGTSTGRSVGGQLAVVSPDGSAWVRVPDDRDWRRLPLDSTGLLQLSQTGLLAIESELGVVNIVDAKSLRVTHVARVNTPVTCMAWNGRDDRLAIGCASGALHVVTLPTGTVEIVELPGAGICNDVTWMETDLFVASNYGIHAISVGSPNRSPASYRTPTPCRALSAEAAAHVVLALTSGRYSPFTIGGHEPPVLLALRPRPLTLVASSGLRPDDAATLGPATPTTGAILVRSGAHGLLHAGFQNARWTVTTLNLKAGSRLLSTDPRSGDLLLERDNYLSIHPMPK